MFDAQPVTPDATITLPVADVTQDVETVGCDDEELTSFSFQPDAEGDPVTRPLTRPADRPDRAGSDGQDGGSASVRSIP